MMALSYTMWGHMRQIVHVYLWIHPGPNLTLNINMTINLNLTLSLMPNLTLNPNPVIVMHTCPLGIGFKVRG